MEDILVDMNDKSKYQLIENIGKVNLNLYNEFFDKKILTEELVLTKNRAEHIDERRYGLLEQYKKEILLTINEPDLIIRDDKHSIDTVISIKKVNDNKVNKSLYVVIKFTLEGNNYEYKNSIITMTTIGEKKLNQIRRNKTILYDRL